MVEAGRSPRWTKVSGAPSCRTIFALSSPSGMARLHGRRHPRPIRRPTLQAPPVNISSWDEWQARFEYDRVEPSISSWGVSEATADALNTAGTGAGGELPSAGRPQGGHPFKGDAKRKKARAKRGREAWNSEGECASAGTPPKVTCMVYSECSGCVKREACPFFHHQLFYLCFRCGPWRK